MNWSLMLVEVRKEEEEWRVRLFGGRGDVNVYYGRGEGSRSRMI